MTHYLVTSAYGVYDDTVPGFLPPDQAARAAAPGSGITVVADYVALDAALVAASKTPTGLGVQSLLQYANNKLNNLRALERSYTLSGSPSVTVKCDSLQSTGTDLISLMTWGQANPSGTDTWVDNEGNTTSITGSQAVTLANDVLAYGKSLWAVLATACAGIKAATITSTSQIDALSWPT